MTERRTRRLELGGVEVVEKLILQGRIPTFSEPKNKKVDGLSKKRVRCIIPGEDGQRAIAVYLTQGNATQIKRTVEQVLRSAENRSPVI